MEILGYFVIVNWGSGFVVCIFDFRVGIRVEDIGVFDGFVVIIFVVDISDEDIWLFV